MNTSKRKQKAIRLGIAAVLALVLLVSVSVVLVIADEPETVKADAMTVTLDGKVNLIFKFNDENVKSGTVSYTAVIGKDGRETDLEFEKVDGKRVVTVPLMPYEMTETVSLYHVAEDGTRLAVSTGSVRDYADEVLANSTYAEHHNKIRALLNYGAMTQIDANANTSNLANADVFVRNNPIDIIKAVPFGELGAKTGDTKYFEDKASVSLAFKGGDIALRYTVIGVDSAPTATFKYGEETVYGTFIKKDDAFTFDISNVGVNNFDTVWDVTITSDGETVTSHHSVLEYLNYLVTSTVTSTGEKITAEEKDVARSLYQLYQNTKNKLETECKHLNPGYYIPAGENSSYHMCAACGEKINAKAIDNKVTAYFSGEHLSGITPHVGDVTTEYSAESGYRITWKTAGSGLELIWLREAYYTSGSLTGADGQWGDVPFDIGNAKYLVIKYKVNENSGITGITAFLGSTEWTYKNTGDLVDGKFVPNNDPSGNPYSAAQDSVYSTKTDYRNGSTDCTAILSLADFGDKVAAANGNRVIDGLKLEIAANMAAVNDTLTIESIEFVTHLGECVNVDGDEYCDDCGKVLPTSAYIMNGEYLMKNKWSANGVHSLDKDGTFVAERDEKGRAWMLLTNNNADRAILDKYSPFSVGNSEYIVIKYKVPHYSGSASGDVEAFKLTLSTKDSPVSTNSAAKGGSYEGISPIYIDPYANDGVKAENADGWTYMVIHAPTVMLNYKKESVYVPDATTGEYVIDCFYIEPRQNSGCDSHFEIGYIAFAETLNDVDALFADDAADDTLIENVIMAKESRVTAPNGVNPTTNDKVVEKVVNGKIQHNMKTTMTEGEPSTVCTVCNRPVLPENTFIDGNFLVALKSDGKNTAFNATASVGNEDGNSYYHVEATKAAEHTWFKEPFKGSDISSSTDSGLAKGVLNASHNVPGFTTVTGDKKILANNAVVSYRDYPALNVGTAKYLVIRARTNFTKPFYLYMGTVGFHDPAKKAGDQCIGVKFNIANADTWVTYVLDLEKVANYEINGEKRAPTVKDANDNDILIFDSFYLNLLVAGEMDIDYIAFVNNLSDVADITVDDSVRIMNGVTSGASTPTNTADLKNK